MKKYIYLSAAVIALALSGCTEEPLSREDGFEITIEAVMAENKTTKTILQEGTTSVLWEAGDEIKLFYDGTGGRFTNQYTEPSGTARFSGSLNVAFGSNEGFSDSTPLWGLYPYRADATADNASVTTTLPAEQVGREGSFAKKTLITLGKSTSLSMGFYNVCGGVRFSLTQEGIKEVVFQGQNDEDIAGKVKLAFTDGVPAVQEVVEGQKTITLTAPNGGTFETGEWYYIVALPGTLSNGFEMTFNTDTQYATLNSSGSKTIKRGIFGSLADADEGLVFSDKIEDEPQDGIIVFADLAAKYACVVKYDTDGDGEVSVEEAEAATTFDGLFTDWKDITSFDEISYFKNVHSLNGLFEGCNKLVSITIPENITDLGVSAFSGCSSLTSVVLPSGITTIGYNTFKDCSSLGSVDIPSGVTSIGQSAFDGCSSLTAVDIPSGVTSIGFYAFRGCSSLSSIVLPSQLLAIGGFAFYGCSSLTQVVIPAGVTSIPRYCFYNCSSLTSVSLPEGLTSIEDYAFWGMDMWKLELPSSISSLGNNCIDGITCVILYSASPVSIQPNTFNGAWTWSEVWGIFVPSNLIDMYGLMTNWANYSSKLHPIDLYKEKSEFTLATSGAVDMGTSVKWAAYNVGASSPEEYGNYFAWGEVEQRSEYLWENYIWCNEVTGKYTKYCPADLANYWDGEGVPDGKTALDLRDDAAHANLGGSWRMPTNEEWAELIDGCLWEWAMYEDVNGYKVYCFESGKTIFLPAAGIRDWREFVDGGDIGHYWSSSLDEDYPCGAWSVDFISGDVGMGSIDRCDGLSVRPIYDDDMILPESVVLNNSSLSLVSGASEQLIATVYPANSYDNSVAWSSNNTSVAKVSSSGVVTAIAAGVATITVTAGDGEITAACSVTVSQSIPEAVDLCLPSGLRWASFNIGTYMPEGYGAYYAWGETVPKDDYSWETYMWCNGSYQTLNKYNSLSNYGIVDNLTVLGTGPNGEDVASKILGGNWRMPTDEEWTELRENCTWTWTTRNNVNGYLVEGTNGNSIFLPAAGDRNGSNLYSAGTLGYYWSSSLDADYPSRALGVSFYSGVVKSVGSSDRNYGLSIRPVIELQASYSNDPNSPVEGIVGGNNPDIDW